MSVALYIFVAFTNVLYQYSLLQSGTGVGLTDVEVRDVVLCAVIT